MTRFERSMAVIGIGVVLGLIYVAWVSRSGVDDLATQRRTNGDIMSRISLAHLWLEEALVGDPGVDLEQDVYLNIDESLVLCRALLEGGGYEGRVVEPTSSPALRSNLDSLFVRLTEWRDGTAQRWVSRTAGKAGSRLDDEYDRSFRSMLDLLHKNREIIEQEMAESEKQLVLFRATVVAVLLLFVGGLTIMTRAGRRSLVREKDFADKLIDSLPGIFYLLDDKGTLLRWNKRYEEVTGYGPGELKGMDALAVFDERERAMVAGRIKEVFSAGFGDTVADLISKDGVRTRYYFTGVKLEIEGKFHLLGVGIDISDREAMEQKLRQSEEYYRSLLENSSDIIMIIDGGGKFSYAAPSVKGVLGYTPEDLVGTGSLQYLHPEDGERMMRVIREHQNEPGSIRFEEYRFRNKKGEWRILEGSGVNLMDHPTVRGIVINARDITEKKELQRQYLRAQRLEGIGSLSSGIAHDLNNILGPILLGSELLAKRVSDASSVRLVETIAAGARRGAGMVKQILAFGRGIAGGHAVIQPGHLIKEIAGMAEQTFPKNIRVKSNVPKSLSLITGDATQIHQVLLNLFVNARDAMPEGGELTVAARDVELTEADRKLKDGAGPGPYVCLSVKDTGTGIPKEVAEKIFDPFFTTKEEGKGTGLGLSTVATIVGEHKGFIELETEPGRGTMFSVYLPAKREAVEELQVVEELPQGNGELVMVVDDEAGSRDLMATILKAYGYSILTGADGVEALAHFASHMKDVRLVIVDMEMPFLDGAATIRALRKIEPNVKILIVSGSSLEGKIEAIRDEVAGVLMKPFGRESLLRKVAEVL